MAGGCIYNKDPSVVAGYFLKAVKSIGARIRIYRLEFVRMAEQRTA